MNYRRVLVTGGAGFIGSHLMDALLERGCRVNAIDDLSTGKRDNISHIQNQISFYHGDIRDRKLMEEAVGGCDTVFHEAAVVSVPKTVEMPVETAMVNDLGTLIVLESARKAGVRKVVLASSCAVYGDAARCPQDEAMHASPKSPYAVQKLTGEQYAALYTELYGLQTVCLRYFNVYGPRQDSGSPYSGVISIFLSKAVSKMTPTIFGNGEQYRDFIFVKDVVRANLLAAESDVPSGNVYNIGTGSFVRIRQLWEMICDLAGLDIEPEFREARAGDIIESVAKTDRARIGLGFKPTFGFENGLHETYDWFLKCREYGYGKETGILEK